MIRILNIQDIINRKPKSIFATPVDPKPFLIIHMNQHPYESTPILFTTLMKSFFFLEINIIFIHLLFKKGSISIFLNQIWVMPIFNDFDEICFKT